MTYFEIVMSGLTALYVAITGYYAWTSHKTLIAIESQGKSSGEQFSQQITEMKVTTTAAKRSADALIASERAWIMSSLEIPPGGLKIKETEAVLLCYCVCSNDGKTPAWITEIKCQIAYVDTLAGLCFANAPTCRYEPEPIAAGVGGKRYSLDVRCKIEQKEFFIVFGVVVYRDMFGDNRRTTFAYRILENCRPIRIASFPEYNKNT